MGKAKAVTVDERSRSWGFRGGGGDTLTQEQQETCEAPTVAVRDRQPGSREGQTGPVGVAEGLVVATKPGHAGGAKGPQFRVNATSG